MAAIVWLVAGILLAAAEMLTGDFTLLMLGGAALLTAGVSGAAGTSLIVDAIVFGVTSVGLLLLVRPMLLRRFASPPPTPTNVHALPGKTARVLETVDGDSGGRVKIDGEVWSARPFDPSEVYPAGETVYIMKIDGAHAVVWKGP
ncbi:NfeD family protein [Nocardia sp. CDC159]|uniref:NfeD family protein n=1 Tax=Nocardia pulmonis TaxID=2951408 RepID=A0A9X2IUM7_9NOCA|nr:MULTISPECIES: NfeD family protein [Nocardia]MCM6772298.1 NfeD family protein [Nocardia pulmonis]MCM6785044.1 NfeD family protein [Nocardia sp. CDC159]